MVQCEMCGTETQSPNRVKIEGAELDVCDECTDFGTEVTQDTGSGGTSTKYSTGSSGSSSGSGGSSGSASGTSSGDSSGGSSGRRRDMYDEMDELAQDYDERIRSGREAAGLSQTELANQLNEKASLIRKLERGDVLPSDEIQRKLERALEIDLSAGGTDDETEWSGSSATEGLTLGDMVEHDS